MLLLILRQTGNYNQATGCYTRGKWKTDWYIIGNTLFNQFTNRPMYTAHDIYGCTAGIVSCIPIKWNLPIHKANIHFNILSSAIAIFFHLLQGLFEDL
jgi:hypothetical protein